MILWIHSTSRQRLKSKIYILYISYSFCVLEPEKKLLFTADGSEHLFFFVICHLDYALFFCLFVVTFGLKARLVSIYMCIAILIINITVFNDCFAIGGHAYYNNVGGMDSFVCEFVVFLI